MKRPMALLLALLLMTSLFACGKKPAPSPSPTPDNSNRGETVTTATPAPEATPKPTPEPVHTPEHTTAPEPTETPAPTEAPATPAPTPAPTAAPGNGDSSLLASGSFRSDTGTALNLVADWQAVSLSPETARITITLSLESYSLDIGERRGNILNFNGEEYYFLTDAIEIDEGFTITPIYVWSKDIPLSELSFTLSVRWNLLGSYSRKEMEAIELSGSYEYRP